MVKKQRENRGEIKEKKGHYVPPLITCIAVPKRPCWDVYNAIKKNSVLILEVVEHIIKA